MKRHSDITMEAATPLRQRSQSDRKASLRRPEGATTPSNTTVLTSLFNILNIAVDGVAGVSLAIILRLMHGRGSNITTLLALTPTNPGGGGATAALRRRGFVGLALLRRASGGLPGGRKTLRAITALGDSAAGASFRRGRTIDRVDNIITTAVRRSAGTALLRLGLRVVLAKRGKTILRDIRTTAKRRTEKRTV
jgi:hypothetical protein